MSNTQRGRVSVDFNGNPFPYIDGNDVPGFRIAGTVKDREGTGALVQRISNGDWLRWKHGRITRLVQRTVAAAMEAAKATDAAGDY